VQTCKGHHYFRRAGFPRIKLPGQLMSPEFMAAYQEAMAPARRLPRLALRGGVERSGAQPLIGVYLLMLKGKIVYVGSSLRMPQRVAEHRSNGRPFDDAFYIATTAKEREALERVRIAAINPPQNRIGRTSNDGGVT
jgi:hypothetical protein